MLSFRLPLFWTAISVVSLMALVALAYLGTLLTAHLSDVATYFVMLGVSVGLAAVLAIPTALVSKSRLGDKRPA